jgi:hypothetical protein
MDERLKIILPIIIVVVIAVVGVSYFFGGLGTTTFPQEVQVGGVTFHVPEDYKLNLTLKQGDSVYNEYTFGNDNGVGIRVYSSKSIADVTKDYANRTGEFQLASNNITYGGYSGKLYQFAGPNGGLIALFLFQKDGKTVAVHSYGEYEEDITQYMPAIIG